MKGLIVIITRYITREILHVTIAVTLILVFAFLCQQGVRYLNFVAVGKIPLTIFLQLISFEAPFLCALLLPFGLYLGVILALGRLQADHELAILQLCGFGYQKMMRVILMLALGFMLFIFILMSWVNPWISAKREQAMAVTQATLHLVQTMMPGRFQASPDGRYVMYVERLSRDRQRADNVFLAQAAEASHDETRSVWRVVNANAGYQYQDEFTHANYFVMDHGYRYEGTPGKKDFKVIQFKKYAIHIPEPEMHLVHQKDEAESSFDLLKNYSQPNKAAELQWRISIALSAFLLAMLAVGLSLSSPKKNRFLILLPAITIYIIYTNFLFISRRWVDEGIVSVAWGMWWVHGLFLLLLLSGLYVRRKRWI